MMLAVLQRRAGLGIGKRDVFAATVGGVRLTEPSVDLAVGLAVASAVADLSVPPDLVAIGEVGLAGEIRRVTGIQRRITEAERMGFRRAIIPAGSGLLTGGAARPRARGARQPLPWPGGAWRAQLEVTEVGDMQIGHLGARSEPPLARASRASAPAPWLDCP